MSDDFATDEAVIEAAHKAVEAIHCVPCSPLPCSPYPTVTAFALLGKDIADDAIVALAKQLHQRREERDDARGALVEFREMADTISSESQRLVGRIRLEQTKP